MLDIVDWRSELKGFKEGVVGSINIVGSKNHYLYNQLHQGDIKMLGSTR